MVARAIETSFVQWNLLQLQKNQQVSIGFGRANVRFPPQGCDWVMIYKWWPCHICLFTSGYLSVSHLDIGSFSSFPRFFSIQIMPAHATVGNLEHLSPMGQHVPKNIHRYMA
jgi:hypothetical protein